MSRSGGRCCPSDFKMQDLRNSRNQIRCGCVSSASSQPSPSFSHYSPSFPSSFPSSPLCTCMPPPSSYRSFSSKLSPSSAPSSSADVCTCPPHLHQAIPLSYAKLFVGRNINATSPSYIKATTTNMTATSDTQINNKHHSKSPHRRTTRNHTPHMHMHPHTDSPHTQAPHPTLHTPHPTATPSSAPLKASPPTASNLRELSHRRREGREGSETHSSSLSSCGSKQTPSTARCVSFLPLFLSSPCLDTFSVATGIIASLSYPFVRQTRSSAH